MPANLALDAPNRRPLARGAARVTLIALVALAAAPARGEDAAYRVDLAAALERDEHALVRRVGAERVTSPDLRLWWPQHRDHPDIEIRFDRPQGVPVSAPWRLVERSAARGVYEIPSTPHAWCVMVAFGRLEVERLRAPDAHVLRGRAPAAHFFIDRTESLEAFLDDWTAVHEFGHLLLPFVERRDTWLSEGLASYYQFLLMACMGEIREAEAWRRLHRGITRARRVSDRVSLRAAIEDHQAGRDNYCSAVYWTGAALFLKADVALRAHADGAGSLDAALGRLRECCLPSNLFWDASEVLVTLDHAAGTGVFTRLHEEDIGQRGFPDLDRVWRALGVRLHHGRVTLDEDAPLAGVRRAITSGERRP